MHDTELSTYFHTFEDSKSLNVKFKILRTTFGKPKYGHCSLCLTEKLEIFNNKDNNNLLNSNLELVTYCLHQRKTLLNDKNLIYARYNHLVSDK